MKGWLIGTFASLFYAGVRIFSEQIGNGLTVIADTFGVGFHEITNIVEGVRIFVGFGIILAANLLLVPAYLAPSWVFATMAGICIFMAGYRYWRSLRSARFADVV